MDRRPDPSTASIMRLRWPHDRYKKIVLNLEDIKWYIPFELRNKLDLVLSRAEVPHCISQSGKAAAT
ncbi:MAG: hypothetical protein QOI70_721 [Microbacteriaceae bacterium]|nr:hypothetical protein [Microbacteriaceae bacterium]